MEGLKIIFYRSSKRDIEKKNECNVMKLMKNIKS